MTRRSLPECGYVFENHKCIARGPHLCELRALKVEAFFARMLRHTKGRWAGKPFVLTDWQYADIVLPMYGPVVWDPTVSDYTRQVSSVWLEMGRKNGKSELLAGFGLYGLCADAEQSAEVYSIARDKDQARVVWDVASRMVMLSPTLSRALQVRMYDRRIIYPKTASFYGLLSRDALGNLGINPHCILFDEVLAQPSDFQWNALRTAQGARVQPLLIGATTAGPDPASFAKAEHDEVVRVIEQPSRAGHRFGYIRTVPIEADPFDEDNWRLANPALGDFLRIETLRQEAIEARNDPTKENSFRMYRLNQWLSAGTRWMTSVLWAENTGDVWPDPAWHLTELAKKQAWIGLDLSARHDLTSCAALIPIDGVYHYLWRHWLPEDALHLLDESTSGAATQWVKGGWLTLTEGAVIDYRELCADIATWVSQFDVVEITYDKWSGEYVRQELARLLGGVPMVASEPSFTGMTIPLTELMNAFVSHTVSHHANPVAAFCFDSVEVQHSRMNPDLIRPVKPKRTSVEKRIDAVPAAALAMGAHRLRGVAEPPKRAAYGF